MAFYETSEPLVRKGSESMRRAKFDLLDQFWSQYPAVHGMESDLRNIIFNYAECGSYYVHRGELDSDYRRIKLISVPHIVMSDSKNISKMLFEVRYFDNVDEITVLDNISLKFECLCFNTCKHEANGRNDSKFKENALFLVIYKVKYKESKLPSYFGVLVRTFDLNEKAYNVKSCIEEGKELVLDSFIKRCREISQTEKKVDK